MHKNCFIFQFCNGIRSIAKPAYYWTKYKDYRNKIKHLTRVSKHHYYNDYFNVNKNMVKKTWKGIKQLIAFRPTKILCLQLYTYSLDSY